MNLCWSSSRKIKNNWTSVHSSFMSVVQMRPDRCLWCEYKGSKVWTQRKDYGIHIAIKNKILINYSRVVREISWIFHSFKRKKFCSLISVYYSTGSISASFIFFEYNRHHIFSFYIYFKNSAQEQWKGLEYIQNHTSLTGDPMAKLNWIPFSFSLHNIKYSYLQQWKICIDWCNTNYICCRI